MADIRNCSFATLDAAQAAELAALVDLEARWENLRAGPARPGEGKPSTEDLHGRQKAYDAFRAALAAYNKRYSPAHVPELLLNTPLRLGLWCKAMRDLFTRVESDPKARCPVHVVDKAYRCADRVAERLGKPRVGRSEPPTTVRAAVTALEGVHDWCAGVGPNTAAPAA